MAAMSEPEGRERASGMLYGRELSVQLYATNLSSGSGGNEVSELRALEVSSEPSVRRVRGNETARIVDVNMKTL